MVGLPWNQKAPRRRSVDAELAASIMGEIAAACSVERFVDLYLSTTLPALDEWQRNVMRSTSGGLLMLCGRQTGKSTTAALLAAHAVTMWPDQTIILLSPTLRQSAELFRKMMVLIDAMPIKPKVKRSTQTDLVLGNGSRVSSLPGSNPETIRGFSAASLVIEDEAAFVSDATFLASRPYFATNPHGRHILLTTPYGKRGHFWERWTDDDPYWQRVMIKSEDCPRISAAFLANERRQLSERAYQQEYECIFHGAPTSVFADDWLDRMIEGGRTGDLSDIEGTVSSLPVVSPGVWGNL